jgi:predicted NAD/FAD-binding protein
MKPFIAIIGGGVAGLTVAYLLQEKYQITLFEKSGRIGGNAYTLTTPEGEEADIAAYAFGKNSYKNVFKLFSKLHIETISPVGINPFNSFGLGLSFCNLETKKSL